MAPQSGLPKPRLRAGLSRPRGGLSALRPNFVSPRPAATVTAGRVTPQRRPLQPSPSIQNSELGKSTEASTVYFAVLYTKRSKKKHKSWLDGYIVVKNDRHVELQNEDGKKVSSERCGKLGGLKEGNTLEVGTYELEVQNPVSEDDYISGRLFVKTAVSSVTAPVKRPVAGKRVPFKPLRPKNTGSESGSSKFGNGSAAPLHDPNAPDACVLMSPGKDAPLATKGTPVVLDPFLAKRMRPHQLEGVKFLYKCVEGSFYLTGEGGQGAILADEMGLGKSLQAIALIWTVLKQSPTGSPFVKKAAIVCPASLVQNWVNEVKKWLGFERLNPVQVTSGSSTFEAKEALAGFVNGSVRRLLIISYEMFRSYSEQMCSSNIGLMVCDEGHRLKSSQGNKTIEALRKVPCPRRVILTGTPVQNDLEEFFAVCDFVNPGCLNSLSSFRNVFANPIISSRDSNANPATVKLGEARAKELGRITSAFVLRRTSDILEKFLPEKREIAIFCRLQPEQEEAYKNEARSRYADISHSGKYAAALSAITYLRKICCHPILIADNNEKHDEPMVEGLDRDLDELTFVLPTKFEPSGSSKIQIALSICRASLAVKDRVVLVSNYTSALDLLQTAISKLEIAFCRLDGSTAVGHRGDIVRRFNQGTLGEVFLLSAKAGGVGLNLIGANRLILFDPDWNPATDLQAMARVWRDGQTKPVFVYRLLSTGTIEEKIYQRQLFKGELQSTLDGEQALEAGPGKKKVLQTSRIAGFKEGNFSAEELRDLFQYNPNHEYCDTLEVLERSQEESSSKYATGGAHPEKLLNRFLSYKKLSQTQHRCKDEVLCDDDDVLDEALNGDTHTHGLVSYLYAKRTGNVQPKQPDSTPHTSHTLGRYQATGHNPSVKRKRAKDLKPLFASDSEDASSEEDPEIKVLLAMRKFQDRNTKGICTEDEKGDNEVKPRIPKTKKHRPSADNAKSMTALQSEKNVNEKNKTCNATWEDALHDLDVDSFDGFQDT